MNLVTVADGNFLVSALNLMCSYRRHSPSFDRIVFCHFNIPPTTIQKIATYFGDRFVAQAVEPVCPHALDPRLYFFKTYALHAAKRFNEPFLYLDAGELIVDSLLDFERVLKARQRVYVQYPHHPFFRNDGWTTNRCFQKLGCDDERFRGAFQYMGGLQAYLPTAENWAFIDEVYALTQDIEIAGPSCKHDRPDGPNGACRQHRNDQSVLSVLIERNGWQQPYDEGFFAGYGDIRTVIEQGIKQSQRPIVLCRQFQRRDFIPQELTRAVGI
ncbi:MAG: hypothetical protein Q8K86_07115 [Candidatus Nanopelagicaceae bacterium]|nr:hypothetical protein [Candidatus Nanopelagicaceae bacterium]